jgi:ABC-type Zn uptake system ZnuABC Zn-binding protein ZnuA
LDRHVRRSLLVLVPALGLLVAACGSSSDDPAGSGGRLKVVATTTQVADFARNVAGADAEVVGLLKPNVDPHDFEPSPADVQDLASADVLLENGVGLEHGWLDQTAQAAGFSGSLVDTSRGVAVHGEPEADADHAAADAADQDHEHTEGDPHIWHDPTNARIMVQNIADALSAADPAHADAFRAHAAAYTAELVALDADIERQIQTLPVEARKLVTNHDAFGYYVERYGLTYVGSIIPSFDTSAALSGTRLNDLVAQIRQTGVKAVFSESSLPGTTAQTLAREAGVRVVAGEQAMYGDTLGPAGSDGATYLEMERHNTRTIVGALSGQ